METRAQPSAPLGRALAFGPQAEHGVGSGCGIPRFGRAHQLTILQAIDVAGPDLDAFAQHALVRACLGDDNRDDSAVRKQAQGAPSALRHPKWIERNVSTNRTNKWREIEGNL